MSLKHAEASLKRKLLDVIMDIPKVAILVQLVYGVIIP